MNATTADAWSELLAVDKMLAIQLCSRVARGALLLDDAEPQWFRRIALDELAMESCDRCILGQLHGDYMAGFRHILRSFSSKQLFTASDYGFTLPKIEQEVEESVWERRFAALAALWRREVRLRIAGEGVAGG